MTTDSTEYLQTVYKARLFISDAQYEKLVAFGQNPSAQGFSLVYNGISNSCIDFTYKALSLIAEGGVGIEGKVWPT